MSGLLSEEAIAKRVHALAEILSRDIDESWMVVALMDGAFVFTADLMRALYAKGLNLEFDSLGLSSEHDRANSSEQVHLNKLLTRDVTDRNILIVDDVFDTGHTLHFARKHLNDAGCATLKTCVFAYKPGKKSIGTNPDYICWKAPDEFLVGYGLDENGRFRGQRFISGV